MAWAPNHAFADQLVSRWPQRRDIARQWFSNDPGAKNGTGAFFSFFSLRGSSARNSLCASMKWLMKAPSCFALFASLAMSLVGHAQTNTNTYYAQLNQQDRRDVSIQAPYAPFGNQTDIDRYGDDGSAVIADGSGTLIWRTSSGGYYSLPGSQVSKPLFVSNSECIVWRNAYESKPTMRARTVISYFRIDAQSGTVNETTTEIDGNKVLETPLVTTTTVPYTLVTANVQNIAPTTNDNKLKNLFVYQLTHNSQTPLLLSSTTWSQGGLGTSVPTEFLYSVDTVAVSSDGSQVVRLIDKSLVGSYSTSSSFQTEFVWVRNDGPVKPMFSTADAFVTDSGLTFATGCFTGDATAATSPSIYMVELSSTKCVFGSKGASTNIPLNLYSYSRDTTMDNVYQETPISLAGMAGTILPVLNFNQKGVAPVFVNQSGTTVNMIRLNGVTPTLLFSATLPAALGSDSAISRLNVNVGYESCAIRDTNNGGIVWLHNGPGRNLVLGNLAATTNYSLIDAPAGRPLFATPGELIVWTNAVSEVEPGGSLPSVIVKHYGRDLTLVAPMVEVTPTTVKVLADATDPNATYPGTLRGTQVYSPYPVTQDPDLWRLETGDKVSNTTLRIRRYQMMSPNNTDEDGDGILGGYEKGPFYVVAGTFTYAEAVADAKRRGGHLATLANVAEFNRMQAAISLWQRNSPLALPKRAVPYPLWLGLDAITNQWDDGVPVYGNWGVGEPSSTVGRTRGRLNSAQQWEAANPNQRTGYLLELAVTDPNAKDTDADGASDYDELFRLLIDPLVPNFGPGSVVPAGFTFASPLVYGNYEGFLTQLDLGPVASFTLSVTNKGACTGRINGASGSASFRGTLDSNGVMTMVPVSLGGNTSAYLSMGVIAPLDPITSLPLATGPFRMSGRLTGLNTGTLVFELRRAGYSKTSPTTDAGSYTIAIPADAFPKAGQPYGDGYLTGTIGQDGRTTLRGSTSDGQMLSWSGSVLEGDFLSFFSMLPKNGGFVGSNLFLRDSAEVDANYGLVGESDLEGDLLVMRKAVTTGASQIAGYGFRSGAYGSKYQPVSYNQLPAFAEFKPGPNNAVMSFIDGAFSGQNVIATWSTNNVITVPKTQTRTMNAKVDSKTGRLSGTYQYNDPNQSYANTKATLGGVVLQKSGEVRGFYTAGVGSGQMVVQPNLDGSSAPVTLIAPRSRTGISEFGTSYKIYVTASEPWSVIVPVSWVTITPRSGTGNAEIVVTVVRNSSSLRRKCDLTIAGLNHHIEQDWNRTSGGSTVTITPVVRTVNHMGATYTVNISGLLNGTVADFASPVDWVTVTPAADMKSASVTVNAWPWSESGYTTTPRTTDVTIGGQTHKVIQRSYYDWYYW